MKAKKVYSSSIEGLQMGVRIFMVMGSLLGLASCQQGKEDSTGDQAKSAGQMNSMGSDSMAGMNHPSQGPMEGSKKNMPGGSEMTRDTNGNYWNSLATNRTVIARQKTVSPVFGDQIFKFSGDGYIGFDMRRNRKIPVRIGGRIERLFVKYNNQYVRRGEMILELYSPELNTYIEEYLYIKRQTTDSVLQDRAGRKLLLLGLSPGQLKRIDQRGSTSLRMPVYSPFEGYVLFDPSASAGMGSTANGSESMSGGMNSENQQESMMPGTLLADNSIREGMYVGKDQTLFLINDFKVALGLIAVGKENEKYLRKGHAVTVFSELLPNKPIETSIQMIEQVYRGGQKFSQARVYLPNSSGRLKQNSLITASFSVPLRSLMIPASSVYDLGRVAIVWLRVGRSKAGSSIFQSRVIRTGQRSKDYVEVLSGLKAGDQIALDAAYLTDSETLIQFNTDQDEK